MKNSIEEDIIKAQHFINSIKTDKDYKDKNGWHGYYNTKIVEFARILEHILSDYKRALKENEQLSTEVNSLKEDNEELKEENFNLQCIAKQYIELYEKYKKLYERSIR